MSLKETCTKTEFHGKSCRQRFTCLASSLNELGDNLGNLASDSTHHLTLDKVASDENGLSLLNDKALLAELSHHGVIDSAGDDVLLATIGNTPLSSGGWVGGDGSIVLLFGGAGGPLSLCATAGSLEADDGAAIGDGFNWW